MNWHNASSQTTPPYTNGHHETPLELSGVSQLHPSPTPQPTMFPEELPWRGLGPLVYGLHRFELGGMPASRYVAAIWLVVAICAAVGIIPGRWITVSMAMLIWVGQIVLGIRLQRQRYVTFAAAPLPVLDEQPLDPTEKLPVYATGLLTVEGRYQHFSMLPGFYRTFATGEHAVLCRVQERKWFGLLNWPLEETGMWYAFVNPAEIEQITWGDLDFGSTSRPALALEYQLEIPPGPRRKHAEIRREILYLASPERQTIQRLYVDLCDNLSNDKLAPHTAHSHRQ